MNYNLEKRGAKFGEEVINFCRNAQKDDISTILIRQIVRSG